MLHLKNVGDKDRRPAECISENGKNVYNDFVCDVCELMTEEKLTLY